MNKIFIYAAMVAVLMICACSDNPTAPKYQKEIAVFGFLWAEQPLSRERAIAITWTQPITDFFDANQAAVDNAQVTITDQKSGRVYELGNDADRPGFYYNDSLFVEHETTYALAIRTAACKVTAETTTPGKITLDTPLSRTTVNQVTPENLGYEKPIVVDCPSPDQVILVDLTCQEAYQNAEYINDFGPNKYPEDQEEYDGGQNRPPRHIQITVKYADLAADEFAGQHVVYWYGAMLTFYGAHTLQILAIDANYHNYLYKENPVLNGGVRGGIGVFGSVSGEAFRLEVVKSAAE